VIACIAAEDMLVADRESVVALAQTAHFVHYTIAPFLYRRVFITRNNEQAIGLLLRNVDACALIRDITVIWYNWTPEKETIFNLTGLNSIAGVSGRVQYLLDRLHSDSKQSLRMIQSWGFDLPNNVPPGVTHICLHMQCRNPFPLITGLFKWMELFPSITHIGFAIVLFPEDIFNAFDNDTVAYDDECRWIAQAVSQQLLDVLKISGARILQLAAHIGGVMSDDVPWQAMVEALYERAGDSGVDQRIRLWRDQRPIGDFIDDPGERVEDANNGINVWSKALNVTVL